MERDKMAEQRRLERGKKLKAKLGEYQMMKA
jgi:hypothetical protein